MNCAPFSWVPPQTTTAAPASKAAVADSGWRIGPDWTVGSFTQDHGVDMPRAFFNVFLEINLNEAAEHSCTLTLHHQGIWRQRRCQKSQTGGGNDNTNIVLLRFRVKLVPEAYECPS